MRRHIIKKIKKMILFYINELYTTIHINIVKKIRKTDRIQHSIRRVLILII